MCGRTFDAARIADDLESVGCWLVTCPDLIGCEGFLVLELMYLSVPYICLQM